ncbi:MAG: XRE family transcriptional regulator [Pseudonocardiales bacterium]|nr:MAG: XRE family transcriptional regulator [Pseudonocardiales bacterium]
MAARMVMRWHLRQVMATRGIFQTSDLVPLLADRGVHLTRQYVHKLVTTPPQRVNMDLLAALCAILDCEPNDLLQPVAEQAEQAKTGTDTTPRESFGIGELRPIRAAVRRPNDGV